MIQFSTTIQKFGEKGEKTGWTYIDISPAIADKLKPGNKKSFRVKGKLDEHPIEQVALLPMGDGHFIMALNATMRKAIGKRKGAKVKVVLQEDVAVYELNNDMLDCLQDEPAAWKAFEAMPLSHRRYYSKWIDAAKTEATKAKRIAMAVSALAKRISFGDMLKMQRDQNQ